MAVEKRTYLDQPKYQQYVERFAELVFKGYNYFEVKADALSLDPELTEYALQRLYSRAIEKVKDSLHKDREYVFKLHMDRYEHLFKQCFEPIENLDKQNQKKQIEAYCIKSMAALKAKEDLVGIHSKSTFIEVNNNVVEYNGIAPREFQKGGILNHLSFEERVELLELLRKIRIVPYEGIRQVVVKTVTDNMTKSTKNTLHRPGQVIDVEFEELPEKVTDKLMNRQEVEPDSKPILSPILIDEVDKNVKPKNLEQIKAQIDDEIKKKFEKLVNRTK